METEAVCQLNHSVIEKLMTREKNKRFHLRTLCVGETEEQFLI